jgi:fructosamine-3-kinase
VSDYLGKGWRVAEAYGRTDEASHPAAILSDGNFPVFVKVMEGDLAWDQLNREMDSLQVLTRLSGVLTPTAVGAVRVGGKALLILEAVEVLGRQNQHWRGIGQALARIHAVQADRFGLEIHSYLGSLWLDNTQDEDWVEFFRRYRLIARLKAAVDSGNLPLEFIPLVEKVSARLPELCGPEVAPALLHGDVHTNNILSTPDGPVFIDPAIYYGHSEMDLASLDFFVLAYPGYFTPVPDEFYQGYQELKPIEPGYGWRRDLWRIPNWLAMVELDGPRHIDSLRAALHSYL